MSNILNDHRTNLIFCSRLWFWCHPGTFSDPHMKIYLSHCSSMSWRFNRTDVCGRCFQSSNIHFKVGENLCKHSFYVSCFETVNTLYKLAFSLTLNMLCFSFYLSPRLDCYHFCKDKTDYSFTSQYNLDLDSRLGYSHTLKCTCSAQCVHPM